MVIIAMPGLVISYNILLDNRLRDRFQAINNWLEGSKIAQPGRFFIAFFLG
ncbi:MAG: hypothetical protein PHR28_04340 [candidate division Zixibacteria bacterium]|nr:hypothetical protein [candidate division Zixibacteria bacterium]